MMKLLTTITILAGVTIAFAQPAPPPDFTALKTATGITDAQITQLQTLQRDERAEVQNLIPQLQSAESNLRTAVTAANPVAATVGQLAIQVQTLRKQIGTIHDSYRARALALLPADAKSKVDALSAAAKLRPAIEEAGMLNLIVPPDPPAPGGPGIPMGMGFRPRR